MAKVSAKSKPANTAVSAKVEKVSFSSGQTFEELVERERLSYTDVNAYAGTDLDIVASRIAVEVTFALSEEIDELNVYSSSFRMGLHRLARWILSTLFERSEHCVVVPDAIPGYTAMGFKRPSFDLKGVKIDYDTPSLDTDSTERQAAAMIVERFLDKSKSQVVVVECKDLLLVLFPVPDMRANLRRMGFLFAE